MDPIIKHIGIAKNGKFSPYKPLLMEKNLHKLDGKIIYITIQEQHPDKTLDQLGFYFGGIIRATCMETELFQGWLEKEIDSFFQSTFLSRITYKEINGVLVEFPVIDRISSLSKKRLSEYIESVIQWLAGRDIYVLDPQEYLVGKYKTVKDAKER